MTCPGFVNVNSLDEREQYIAEELYKKDILEKVSKKKKKVKKLATKRTSKSIKSNKKNPAKKVKQPAQKVAKKKVLVVEKTDPGIILYKLCKSKKYY